MPVENIITENLDIWTSAIKTKSTSGRGSSNKLELYGIKKLRELILELAVRGKLVPQKSDEEDAHVLIKSIEQTKKELLAVEKIKKAKQLPEVIDTEEPYDLPVSWVWTRLGNLTEINPRNLVQDEGMNASFVPMPLISTSFDGRHGTETRKWAEIKKGYTHFANGDIGLAKITPCFENSKAVVFSDLDNGIGAGTTELHIARPYTKALNPNFVLLYLKSPIFLSEGESRMTGSAGQKRVPKEFFSSYPFPLPPSKEQERIVCKVTELMTLCDQLESQTEASIEAHQTLVKSLLETLTNAKDADELKESWQRISEHFDVLFTTEDSIDQLKQTILQLAVMGKLVKQDPNDESASNLLKRIAAEKERLIKNKKIKKQKALPLISEGEKPFQLPRGWEWCRLEDVVDIQSGITKGRKLAGKQVTKVAYLSVANVQRGFLKLEQLKDIEIAVEEVARYEVRAGDLLITEGGDWDKVGRTAIWNGSIPYIAHQNHVFKARKLLDEQNELWLETYLNSPFARDYFAGSSKQTTNLASINKTQLRGCLIAIPPSNHQSEILSSVRSVVELCESLLQKLKSKSKTVCSLAELVAHR